ncbi:hypothetical protein [Dietzia sp. ANT_WB102]|uniref:hypothetical protein n=1 Tax=Dietzia sp. ANT_WB102 TaxID=2597345 RepID=UPI0021077E2D|nr:hypothetical protein [Dietzia sp. ANT_WB102]
MNDFERNKDQVQAGVQAGASLVGRIAVIITDAIGSIARELGDFVTEGIEMREAAALSRRAEKTETTDGRPIDVDDDDEDGEDGDLPG